jgi:hypothetical protein
MQNNSIHPHRHLPPSLVPSIQASRQKFMLILVRTMWIIFVPLLLGLACVFFRLYMDLAQTVCDGSACSSFQSNSGTVRALSSLGLSPQGFVWFIKKTLDLQLYYDSRPVLRARASPAGRPSINFHRISIRWGSASPSNAVVMTRYISSSTALT